MNELHKAIYNKVVAPELKKRRHSTKGRVILYDHVNNRAIVEWEENGIKMTKIGCSVTLTGGSSTSGPFAGDVVWLEFANGNPTSPKIIALVDESYENNIRVDRMKHERKGAYVPDLIDGRII